MASPFQDTKSDTQADVAADGGIDTLPILTTKLYRPPATPELEPRARLLERLNRNLQRPLTLIAAPAGYGKTVLASQWLETCDYPSAWLSLDESDNDLGVFLSYLLAAISGAFPDLNFKTLNLMAVPNLPSIPLLAQMLINDLDQISEPFILVLDDVHRLHHPEISDLFDLLLKRPPLNLHLVLIGRHDPAFDIITLRARSQVTEIRTLDLRFTPQETIQLMQKMLGREVDPAVAADWTQKTEGWVTALRLAVLSLRHRGQADDLSVPVRGDSRYLRDYLLAEVLSHLPKQYQNCLIKIAFLDRFCGPLCDAICQTDALPESNLLAGETFIDWLECENLFLIPLDDQHRWFRFHHLFQELLLDLLQAKSNTEEINFLRMRASNWFLENGLLDEAIQYALAANDTVAAGYLVEQHRYELMNSEQWRRLDIWMKLLPEDQVTQHASLLSAKAYVALFRGEDLAMVTCAQQAERLLDKLPSPAAERQIVQAELDVIQAVMDNVAGQVAQSMARTQSSLQVLPSTALFIRLIAIAGQVIGHQMQGDLPQGLALVREVLSDRAWPVGLHAKLMQFPCIACHQEGDLLGVLEWGQRAIRIADEQQRFESLSEARYHVGVAHYLRNEFAQAEPYLLALWQDRAMSAPNYLGMGVFVLALIYLDQDRLLEAEQVIDLISAHFQETRDSFALANTEAFRVELALRKGNLVEAHRLSKGIRFDLRPPIWFFYVPQLTPIKLLLAKGGTESLQKARVRLEVLDEEMRKINRNNVRIDALALLACVQAAHGDIPAAISSLDAALLLGARGGFIRNFVDLGAPMAKLLQRMQAQKTGSNQTAYIEQILEAFPAEQLPKHTPVQVPLDEPLTNRELEVLALLAQRLSNKEIAAELVISPRTVKRHTLNIYKKLAVNSRQQAVKKASALGIFV